MQRNIIPVDLLKSRKVVMFESQTELIDNMVNNFGKIKLKAPPTPDSRAPLSGSRYLANLLI